MTRRAIWKSIADSLTTDIAGDKYAPGDKLPTEAELSARFGVNRHTVRRALQDMSEKGLVLSRRGAGVFVASKPADYPIGRRVRFTQNLRAAGRSASREIIVLETRGADVREAEALNIAPGDSVHVYEGLSKADGQPIALGRSVFPAARVPDILSVLNDVSSVTDALARCGISDYTRASTRLTAKLATPTQALHLRLRDNAPILRTVNINVDPNGVPIEYGHTWFAGDRVTLTVEL
jgi:GntR family phosphonate transport system transcriptional regulator